MNIAIIGSREGFDKEFVFKHLLKTFVKLSSTYWTDTKIISGGARGIDTYAYEFGVEHEIQLEIIRPINPANKLDYLFRNVEIITKADKIIAFWDGKSKGTKFIIDYAKARSKNIEVIEK